MTFYHNEYVFIDGNKYIVYVREKDTVFHRQVAGEVYNYVIRFSNDLVALYLITTSGSIQINSFHITVFLKMVAKYPQTNTKENIMKTDFTMPPQTKPNTYPAFMLNKTKGYVVLLFRDGCGVVVSGNKDYEVNHFSTSWLMELFTPVEGCSVTFSDKD